MNSGLIYIIKNKKNNKVYIGQTTRSIKSRWEDHEKAVKDKNKNKSKIYKAMIKHGIENFYYEILEYDISLKELDEKEVYYISLYNSFKNGYNATPGGKGGLIINSEDDIRYIINEYNKGKTSTELASEYGVCGTTILRVLRREGIKTRECGRKLDISMLKDIEEKIKNHTYKEIGIIYGVDAKTVYRFLSSNGVKQRNRRK